MPAIINKQSWKRIAQLESFSGFLLLAAALVALICANSPLSSFYESFLAFSMGIKLGSYTIAAPITFWINNGLMTLFFMLMGIEVKKEMQEGTLIGKNALLPLLAAMGGVAVPALIYGIVNWGLPSARGWAIPSATDIAFSLAILALFGSRVHPWLKIFLLSVAVIDDVIAVIIIALFYTGKIVVPALLVVAVCISLMIMLNRYRVQRRSAYAGVALVLWAAMLISGVHATIAGVLIGLLLPRRAPAPGKPSMADRVTGRFDRLVSFLVLPLFAFTNSGIGFEGLSLSHLAQPIPLGIVLGLFFGKQIGIVFLSWLALRFGLATKPAEISWLEFYGVALLAGIGFTMSLFIGVLAFNDPGMQFYTRLGVMLGSFLSAVAGYVVLTLAFKKRA